ncbi:hypothetical protein KAR91_30055, partial [Candidatus Pacearchaeota archaeon]|nr:hypothetical protein [Candidatus Pacearchaeota archaeon]
MKKVILILLLIPVFCQAQVSQWFTLNRNYAESLVCVDLSVNSYTYGGKELTNPETAPTGFHWREDGTSYYTIGVTLDEVAQWDLSTAWDIETGTNVGSISVNDGGTLPIGVAITIDGSIMYVCNYSDDKVHQYDLSTAWLITSATHTSSSSVVSPANPPDIEISEDGSIMWIMAANNIKEYSLTPGDITTLSDNSVTLTCGTEESACMGFTFCPTGFALYVIGTT